MNIHVYQMTTRHTSQIKTYEPKQSFLKKHEGTILEVLFAAYLAYLFLQFFTN